MRIIAKSAFKHGITYEQINDVLRSNYTEIFDEGFERTGLYSAMYVGFDSQSNLIEVKMKFALSKISDKGHSEIFHADIATKKYRDLFNEAKGK